MKSSASEPGLKVVKCSNGRHFPSPSRICKCCGCVFFRGYHHIICHPLLKKGVPCVCKTYHWEGGGRFILTLAPERGKFTYFQLHKKWMPRSTPRGWPGLQMTGLVQWSVFKSCKNDKRNSDLFFKVMRKRETKFKSVFQSNAKTKNEKRNSYPFFKVMRKRKTKTEIDIRFSKWCENEKRNTKFKTVFQS